MGGSDHKLSVISMALWKGFVQTQRGKSSGGISTYLLPNLTQTHPTIHSTDRPTGPKVEMET